MRNNESHLINLLVKNTKAVAIVMLDKKGYIRSWNLGVLNLKGYQEHEVIGKHFSIFYAEKDVKKSLVVHALTRAKKTGHYVIEAWQKRKDGSFFWAEVSINALEDESGEWIGFSKVTLDLTEKKKLQAQKDEFISIVSHELRTPLTSILGALSLMRTEGTGAENKTNLLNIAYSNAERLARLISNILDVQKITTKRMQYSMREVNLSRLIEESIYLNMPYANLCQASVECFGQDEDFYLVADADRLQQVFTNLLSNAYKFSPEGSVVRVQLSRQKNQVKVSFTNGGKGIPKALKDRIFTPFTQGERSKQNAIAGTGLGLAISKGIIEDHQGKIGFTSKKDKETTFWVRLPLSKKIKENKVIDTSKARLLICEDDPDQASYLNVLLHDANFLCDVAHTAEQALHLLENRSYQAILLDIVLPDDNGIELIRKINSTHKNQSTPIIVTSIMADASKSLVRGGLFHVVAWLQKPLDFMQLSKALRQLKKEEKKKLILHVEDDEEICTVVKQFFEDDFLYGSAASLKEAKDALKAKNADIVILDLHLPDGDGSLLLPLIAKANIPVVVFSSYGLKKGNIEQVKQVLNKAKTTPKQLVSSIKKYIGKE